jgi:hypothetical protein
MSTSHSLPKKNSSGAGGAEASFENISEDIMTENGPVALSPAEQTALPVDGEQAIAQLSALGYEPWRHGLFPQIPTQGREGIPPKLQPCVSKHSQAAIT